jgi:hypothetical protein
MTWRPRRGASGQTLTWRRRRGASGQTLTWRRRRGAPGRILNDLARELEFLAAEVDWPDTPQLATRAAIPPRRRRPRRPRRRVAIAIALAALVLATAALAATGVIHFSSGVTIHRVEQLPSVDPAPELALGRPVAFAEAQKLLTLKLPPRLRRPDAAYASDVGVNLLYLGPRGPHAVLAVLREDGAGLIDKLVYTSTRIRRVHVEGARGIFIAGVHVVDFLYGPGRRLSQPTLLWTRDGLTYRLESRDALELASAR